MDVHAIKTGYIIMVHNPPQWRLWFSSIFIYPLLRLVTSSYFHHCGMFIWVDSRLMVAESLGTGVQMTDYNIWLARAKRDIEIIPLPCDSESITKHVGKKYDKVSFFFYCLWKVVFKRWIGKAESKADKKLYCFEYVAMVHHFPNWWNILPDEFNLYALNVFLERNPFIEE